MDHSSCSVNGPPMASNYNEILMHQSLLFVDCLKDLKEIRKQLYSAAEYFELSYHKNDQKDFQKLETLKEYLARAFVSTVDHLGSVTSKMNCFLEEKIDQVSRTKLQISCIEQRLGTCREYIAGSGLSQQSLVIQIPRYHKRYILSEGEIQPGPGRPKALHSNCIPCPQSESKQTGVQETKIRQPRPTFWKRNMGLLPKEIPADTGATFSFARLASSKEPGKRANSPLRFSLKRSGSNAYSSTLSRGNSNAKQMWQSESRRSVMICMEPHTDEEKGREIVRLAKKNSLFLKAIFSINRSRNDATTQRQIRSC